MKPASLTRSFDPFHLLLGKTLGKRYRASSWFRFRNATLALLVFLGLLILVTGTLPGDAFLFFLEGAFGSARSFELTLLSTMPMVFTGLSVAIALKAGLFNIGAQGQMIIGALLAATVGVSLSLPPGLHLIAVMLAGAVGGALWALPAGAIKVWRGGHEVISTIMLNAIAEQVAAFMIGVGGPLQAASKLEKTETILPTAQMPVVPGFTQLSWSLPMGMLLCVLLWGWLNRTPGGFELRAVGANPDAAEANGISQGRYRLLAMTLAGAFAGLAGAALVTDPRNFAFVRGFTSEYGFNGLAVALIAGGNPLWVMPSALLFGAIESGASFLRIQTDVPKDIASVVRGAVVLYVAILAWNRQKGKDRD